MYIGVNITYADILNNDRIQLVLNKCNPEKTQHLTESHDKAEDPF